MKDASIDFQNPFLSLESEDIVRARLIEVIGQHNGISAQEISDAVHKAWRELKSARRDMQKAGEAAVDYLKKNDGLGIVLAGRPYHIDPEINHGIPEMITAFGVAVLTEDSVSHLGTIDRPTLVVDQWMYHSRLYAAASYVRTNPNLELIQLNSFGCGLDAVTTDQVADILNGSGKIYTSLKIDEVNNLGPARIRVRSLLSAVKERHKMHYEATVTNAAHNRVIFTTDMRKNYTILVPQMSPIHFELMKPAFASCGYNVEILPDPARSAVDTGLKYVNNDACYPSLIVVGQLMEALASGKYDKNKVALLITQTGGGCRATNYISFIRRALQKMGEPQIPVVSLSAGGIEKNPGFTPDLTVLTRAMQAVIYGDVFMRVVYRTRPYEEVSGSVNELHRKWAEICKKSVQNGNLREFNKNIKGIVEAFDAIPLKNIPRKPRVGIVGEILVKFLPAANNDLVGLLESEGAEVVVPDLLDFLLYSFYNNNYKHEALGKSKKGAIVGNIANGFLEYLRKGARKCLAASTRFDAPARIEELAEYAEPIVSIGNQTGEGWFLTGEMLELIHSGVNNIVCAQPFACLPNHVVGKGVIKELRARHPLANIVAVDYDPGASEVNQLNRIKLMLATAERNLKK